MFSGRQGGLQSLLGGIQGIADAAKYHPTIDHPGPKPADLATIHSRLYDAGVVKAIYDSSPEKAPIPAICRCPQSCDHKGRYLWVERFTWSLGQVTRIVSMQGPIGILKEYIDMETGEFRGGGQLTPAQLALVEELAQAYVANPPTGE